MTPPGHGSNTRAVRVRRVDRAMSLLGPYGPRPRQPGPQNQAAKAMGWAMGGIEVDEKDFTWRSLHLKYNNN